VVDVPLLIARWTHIGLGGVGFALGLVATMAPKFGRWRAVHRFAGRAYAVVMLGSAILSVPLAVRLGSVPLLIIGTLTTAAVALGWRAVRVVRSGHSGGDPRRLLRRHVILMGSSYIAAWTAFLLSNPVFATGNWWDGPLHRYGPTVVGSAMIAWYVRRRLPRALGGLPAAPAGPMRRDAAVGPGGRIPGPPSPRSAVEPRHSGAPEAVTPSHPDAESRR
jgi:hypothetical protein